MSKKSKNIEEFRTDHGGFLVSITITNGKISRLAFWLNGRGGSGGYTATPGDSVFNSCRYDVFSLMAKHDTQKFKVVLTKIKDLDSDNYEYGISILKRLKDEIMSEANKIISEASKFDF